MKKAGIVFLLLFVTHFSFSQCPGAGFTIQSPVCAGSPLNITNTTTGASTYEWNFCPYTDFTSTHTDTFNSLPILATDIFGFRLVRDSATYYGFCRKTNGDLVRIEFGNSMENVPSPVVAMNNAGFGGYSPMAFTKQGGNWYGFLCGYGGDLVRLDFGTSLANTPVQTGITATITAGVYCMDMAIEDGNIFLFIGSYDNKNMTVLNFGNNVLNTTPSSNLLAASFFPGANGLVDVDLTNECGNWYAVVLSYNGAMYKLNFGDSLSNPNPVSDLLPSMSSFN